MPGIDQRSALEPLTKARLAKLADHFELELGKSRTKAELIDGIASSPWSSYAKVLEQLSRDELKAICRAHGLDDTGRAKQDLIDRIRGPETKATENGKSRPEHAAQASLPGVEAVVDPSARRKRPRSKETDEPHDDTPRGLSRSATMTDAEADTSDQAGDNDVTPLEEGKLLDYITGEPVKDTPKEQVRQRIVRGLLLGYSIPVKDMVADFKMKIDGRRKSIDIAIFEAGAEKTVENLRRIVICDKAPKTGTKGAYKMRDHEQAEKEFGLLYAAMGQPEAEGCRWGLWTNGLDFFFFEKERTRFDVNFHPRGDWPMADGTLGSRSVASVGHLRSADRDMLLTAFRRCHNYIHGNEGMPKDAAFWQFLYLIFAKLHDERRPKDQPPRFWAGMFEKQVNGKKQLVDEQFEPEGQKAIRDRVKQLVDEVAEKYKDTVFRDNPPRITLSDRALAFVVAELAKYDLRRTRLDAKGAAYQELVKHNIRGDRGQYFTPRGVVDLLVAMLDPKLDERVMDPACGTGGFLVSTLKHLDAKLRVAAGIDEYDETTEQFLAVQEELRAFAEHRLFGADFDPFLVRAAQMNVLMASNGQASVYNMNSLEFPAGHLPGVAEAKKKADLGSMHVVITNPPFGSNIPITDRKILERFDLANVWDRTDDGGYRNTGKPQGNVAPEVLFIERCVQWLRPGGRMGIVLPDGILGNPKDEYIRWWILRHCWVLASVDLPVEAFIVDANVNILTSLLVLKKKTDAEKKDDDLGRKVDYPVFMAVAEKVGFDRRGNTLYKHGPDGEEIFEEVVYQERVTLRGQPVVHPLRRKERTIDDDLPLIAKAYREFRASNREPGV